MKKLILILLILPIQAQADFIEEYGLFEPFGAQDWIMQGVFTSLVYIDWRQTKRFREDGIAETNPILGKYPSQQKVDNLIFLGAVSHVFISWALPKKYRATWQVGFSFIELNAVINNKNNNETYANGDNIIVFFGFEF